MSHVISRRRIADYVATQYQAGTAMGQLLDEVAAYLIDTKLVRYSDVMVRDIEEALERHGVLIARVTSAHPLDDILAQRITQLLSAPDVHLVRSIDPQILGGVLIETPSERLDMTVRQKLTLLQQAKQ